MKSFRLRKARTRKQGVLTDHSILDLYPLPALVIDDLNQTIQYANPSIYKISGFKRSALVGNHLSKLLNKLEISHIVSVINKKADDIQPLAINTQLLRPNQPNLDVTVHLKDYPLNSQLTILFIHPQEHHQNKKQPFTPTPPWDAISRLIGCIPLDANSSEFSIDSILEAGTQLSNAESAAIYLIEENSPSLHLANFVGFSDWLPTNLSPDDISQLLTPYTWKTGRRILSTIHRIARNAGLIQVTTSPIGKPNALIGMGVVAWKKSNPPEEAIRISELISATIHISIQLQLKEKRTLNMIQKLRLQKTTSDMIEKSIREGIITLDNNLLISRINNSAELIFGYEPDEARGKGIDQILIGNTELKHHINLVRQESNPLEIGPIQLYRRSGESFPAYLSILPIPHIEEANRILLLISDLSEQVLIQEQAQKLENQAFLGDLSAVFAHEVRNPINNISTGLELLEYEFEDQKNRERVSRLREDCDRLENLMKSILTYSKTIDYKMVKVDIVHLLHRLLDRLEATAKQFDVSIKLQTPSEKTYVKGNYRALEQVFTNLFENSIQAMKEKGGQLAVKVMLNTEEAEREVVHVSVADTGPGVPEEEQKLIFQPFFTTKSDGTGLGLAISKRIITAHKGSIQLQSFPGCSIFQVEVPVYSEE